MVSNTLKDTETCHDCCIGISRADGGFSWINFSDYHIIYKKSIKDRKIAIKIFDYCPKCGKKLEIN